MREDEKQSDIEIYIVPLPISASGCEVSRNRGSIDEVLILIFTLREGK